MSDDGRIYLDHNATSPLRREAREEILRVLESTATNPSSMHAEGRAARAIVERARDRVAELAGAKPAEVVFTSGGTEADNLAVRGIADLADPAGRRHLVVSAIEYEAVLQTARALHKRAWIGLGISIETAAM